MKVVIFCGGMGMRIRDYSNKIPKPMVPIRGKPILWHIMKSYAEQGHTEFVLCLGYKQEKIIEHFDKPKFRDWKIHFVDTGMDSTIGDRLRLVKDYVKYDQMFLATYGDGLTDCRIADVIALHVRRRSIATFVTAKPQNSFHIVDVTPGGLVRGIKLGVDQWMNAGYFVFRPEIFEYLQPGEEIVNEAFTRLIAMEKVTAYKHTGFWQAVDTFKDLMQMEKLASVEGVPAPWETWDMANPPQPKEPLLAPEEADDSRLSA